MRRIESFAGEMWVVDGVFRLGGRVLRRNMAVSIRPFVGNEDQKQLASTDGSDKRNRQIIVGGSLDKQGTDPRIAAQKSVELLRKSKVDKPGSISWTLKSPYESPTLSMYDRIIASPTTARMDLVACTSSIDVKCT